MTNPHFGTIGDVWKHLVLGDVLDRLRPSRYWETHAGSGTYELDRVWQREYGIFTLLREAPRAPAINASRYVGLVRSLPPGDGETPRYPGSARLAMEVLGEAATYLLCDLDASSVTDLSRTAREVDLGDLVRVERADGIATVWDRAQSLAPEERSSTCVLLDPFDEDVRSPDGMDTLDLFARLADAGVPTVLWRGFDDAERRAAIERHERLPGRAVHSFEIETAWLRGETSMHSDVGGCALVLANVEAEILDHVERLGRQLEACYDEVVMPDGSPGGLRFTRAIVARTRAR